MALSWNKYCRASFVSFSFAASLVALCNYFPITAPYVNTSILDFISLFIAELVVLRLIYRGTEYDDLWKVALRSAGLGLLFAFGTQLVLYTDQYQSLGCYLLFLSFFHWSEFASTALTNPGSLGLESFLLDHSPEYQMAAVASWLEYAVQLFLFPDWKSLHWLSLLGLVLCFAGEALRKIAMFTAKTNFNHHVQYARKDGHVLVTWGVYSWFRHPAYVGWFYWSVGTQLLLGNPLCCVAYALASWRFFSERIRDEEETLVAFFGSDYVDYQQSSSIGIPFIRGYRAAADSGVDEAGDN